MNSDTGVRLKLARQAKDITQAKLAKAVGLSQSAIGNIESGTRGFGASIIQIANELGVDAHWLATGEGEMIPSNTTANVRMSLGTGANVDPMIELYGVPLISWVQAGTWSEISDPYLPGDAEDWLPCPIKHGPRAYCLRVRGDSMFNPGARPSYANGDIIFVDPDRAAQPGDRVVVRLDDQQEATFKQLVVEDGRKLLKALNPEWKPRYVEINENATITGVIIGKWVPE